MDFQIGQIDILEGVITYEDGRPADKITLTSLINLIINFINALIKNEF